MPDDFLIRAALAGIGLTLATGPLGCFVVWRRLAYFGDATAHAAILGVAMSLAFAVSPVIGVLVSALAMALALMVFAGRSLSGDTVLGVASHGALATGLVAVALSAPSSIRIETYLFGEILAVTTTDLAVIWTGALAVGGLIVWRWTALLTATLNPDLAWASGFNPRREQLVLTLALAVVVAVAIKVVGALLITALLIIPAATARPFSRTPEVMAALAVGIGVGAVVAGLSASFLWDTPSAPTIVTVAVGLFLLSHLVFTRRSRI